MPRPTAPDSMPAVLAEHAATSPHAPWLFSPRGLDWNWISFADGARRVAAMAETIAAAGLPAGASLAFLDVPRPETVCIDLAIRAAGLTPVPVAPEQAAAGEIGQERQKSWVGIMGERGLEPAAGIVTLRVPWESAKGMRSGLDEFLSGDGRAGDAAEADVLAAAARLAAALPPGRDLGRSRREVVVFGGRLGERGDRVVLAWALVAGAAVLLERAPAAVVPTAVWARPTLFHGDAARLGALRLAVGQEGEPLAARLARRLVHRDRTHGRPLGRLHTLVLTGPAPLPDAGRAFWRARGVAVVALT